MGFYVNSHLHEFTVEAPEQGEAEANEVQEELLLELRDILQCNKDRQTDRQTEEYCQE